MAVLNKYTCIYGFLINLEIVIINFNTRKRWAYIRGGAYNRANFFCFLGRWARVRGGLVRGSVLYSVLPRFSSGLRWEA